MLLLPLAECGPSSFGAHATEQGVLPQSPKIQGRDGGHSGLVWGHSVWTFGDTVLNVQDELGTNWHHNSYSITDDLVAADGIGGFTERLDSAGAPRYFLFPTSGEAAFNAAHYGDSCAVKPCGARYATWPGAPIWDAPRSRAIIFYDLIYAEPGYNFHSVGASVALWNDFAADPERPGTTPMFQEGEPEWGTAALIDRGMLYVFSCHGNNLGPPCSLASVDPMTVLDRSTWRFWDGASWSADMGARQPLFDGAPSVSVAWSAHLKKYAAIYCEPLSNRVVIRTAPSLTGPWTDRELLFEADKEAGGAYDVSWHSEYDDGSTIYLTFSRSNGIGWFGSEFVLERVVLP